MTSRIYRFAPSPNGHLHIGHAYSALFTQAQAQHNDGSFLLRIEDIDYTRCQDRFVDDMFTDLNWLGVTWPSPVRFQSQHLASYNAALNQLKQDGLLYPCFCSRAQLARDKTNTRTDPDGRMLYPGHCRALTAIQQMQRIADGELHSLRINMTAALSRYKKPLRYREHGIGPRGETGEIIADPALWGDAILARKDIATSYHIAVVVDDAEQAITHVTRGIDLFYATSLHRLLQELLQLPVPAYHHHRLIDDETGRKLSKSANDRTLGSWREAGISAKELRRILISSQTALI